MEQQIDVGYVLFELVDLKNTIPEHMELTQDEAEKSIIANIERIIGRISGRTKKLKEA